MPSAELLRVAIAGSGPSACFTVEALLATGRAVEVDVLERLHMPFGLARFGIAPDHPETRRIAETFARHLSAPPVRLFTGVELGRTVDLEALRANYDAVVLATGAAEDAGIAIPGTGLAGVYGAAAFVGWYTGHPDFIGLDPLLDQPGLAVIGNGNVALDIARLLARTSAELEGTEIAPATREAIAGAGIRDIYLIGRRGPLEAKFTNPELRELAGLADAGIVAEPASIPAAAPPGTGRMQVRNLEAFRAYASAPPRSATRRIHFLFDATPEEIVGSGRVTGLRLCVGRGEKRERLVACGAVVTATGFLPARLSGLPFDGDGRLLHKAGRVAEGLYAVGWLKRGPSGVLGTSKPDGFLAAQSILEEVAATPGRRGRKWLEAHLGRTA
ncbi:hypothetical protein EZH22_13910 [Xanthobacter dioxanivorans]|uniref:Pyridine nucleotide-disulfide oxidoreductase n=1 Tax=Xanthobacter dioxanivorans TaxID=2528964 RepID=A0A974SLE9_9HYPH|nr:hypothetical protein [Xanthobacter dioxanivorans]QRG09249.1 hypothetical protein EZH22_13910 [Xanthobacter dioxanivorans]